MSSQLLRQAIRRYSSLPKYALEPAFKNVDVKAANAFKHELEASQHHAKDTSKFWIRITAFVAVPAVALTAINTYFVEKEHAEHREHLEHISDEDWPKNYEYMNIRSKPFFWGDGDKTLFWNPIVNRHIRHE